jgi:hypothetical protein
VSARFEILDVLAPRFDRVRLIESHERFDVFPEKLDVGLTEDRFRPAFGGVGDDRPVHLLRVYLLDP